MPSTPMIIYFKNSYSADNVFLFALIVVYTAAKKKNIIKLKKKNLRAQI